MDAFGVNVDSENESVTIKGKDENKLDDWKNDAMNWLGFEYVEE